MTTLMQASRQWATRPADERFVSLHDLAQAMLSKRANSAVKTISSRSIECQPIGDKDIIVQGPDGSHATPTHWAFGQLASLANSPAGYLRTLPAPIAADCINYGLRFSRDVEDIGALLTRDHPYTSLRSANGPRYGRIWDSEVADALVHRFGDGITGQWRVPGEFGREITVTKDNTTLFGGDRDMFVFLADEKNRVEVPNRRDGKPGALARGFFVWNSETGNCTLGAGFFLYDYVCCNRIVWGAQQYQEIRIRHTSGAPDRWLEEVAPVLAEYSEASAKPVQQAIEDARSKRLDSDLTEFLAKRFGKRAGADIAAIHLKEEGRPIETLWDVATGATAYARLIPNNDKRVEIEREAGKVLDLAA